MLLQLESTCNKSKSYYLHAKLFALLSQVMVKRQKSAFPPNFVHSLDGSHMMMTAVACREAGLNFAGPCFLLCNITVNSSLYQLSNF